MQIIGAKSYNHDQSFCLLKDGEVLYFCEEERFNRSKHSWHYTHESLDYLIQKFNIDKNAPTYLNDYDDLEKFKFENLARELTFPGHDPEAQERERKRVKREILISRQFVREVYGFKDARILDGVDHHLLHAASAFFPSPFEEAAILIMDGSGDGFSTLIARGQKNRITPLYRIPLPHSLGDFYAFITMWLGLGGFGDEGKTMGAAPYGDWRVYYELFRKKFIDFDEDGVFYCKFKDLDSFHQVLGPNPGITAGKVEMTQQSWDVAAAAQKITEEIMLRLSRHAQKLSGEKKLCLAGGVALNSVSNGKILRSRIFDDVWIQPAANDAGLSIGGALWNHYVVLDHPRETKNGKPSWWVQEHTYWGPEYADSDVEESLKYFNLPIRKIKNVEAWTAGRLQENKVLGWFQGRIELGPRALGNRTILANPTHPDMKDIVNRKVKFREPWRPFAPSVLEEDCSLYFDSDHESPYMILVYGVKPEWREKLPAITHVDGTARVQTVSKKTNPRYYRLIEEFKKLSGVGMVMNTSYNLKGEPIVLTPKQAIMDFLRTEMDVLVLHDYVLEKGQLGDYSQDKVFPRFHPVHDNVDKLKDGHYILFDLELAQHDRHAVLENLFRVSSFRPLEFTLIPFKNEKSYYQNFVERFPVIRHVTENLNQTEHLELNLKNNYTGGIIFVPHSMTSLANHGAGDWGKLIRFISPLISGVADFKIYFLDAMGVLSPFEDYFRAINGVNAQMEKMLVEEKNLDVTQAEFYRYVLDLERRFGVNLRGVEHGTQ